MRIFTVAQMEDNSIQIKKDLEKFMYQLRLNAEVQVVEMHDKDISAYTYERTLMMEQRGKLLQQIKRTARQSNPQLIVDASHPSTDAAAPAGVKIQMDNMKGDYGDNKKVHTEKNLYTFSANAGDQLKKDFLALSKPDKSNVRRMHTAVRLNEAIREKSSDAKLTVLNLPCPPKNESGEENYMEFLEVLTEGLDRVLMVRGSGTEVITIYS